VTIEMAEGEPDRTIVIDEPHNVVIESQTDDHRRGLHRFGAAVFGTTVITCHHLIAQRSFAVPTAGARLDTAQAVAAGVLERPANSGPIPQGRAVEEVDGTPSDAGWVVQQMAAGCVLQACNYFGIPYVWAEADHWRGCLLQYREVVEDMTFDDAEKAAAWFVERCRETEG
jgi:hypothetical protein